MGWKTLKEAYGITQRLNVTPQGIAIGSGYIDEIATIDTSTGEIKKGTIEGGYVNKHMPRLAAAPAAEILAHIQAEDVFTTSIPVYTYHGGEIIEKRCEVPGWPNSTHDGVLMHNNTFSTDKNVIIATAKEAAALHIECIADFIKRLEDEIAQEKDRLAVAKRNLEELNKAYPDPATNEAGEHRVD